MKILLVNLNWSSHVSEKTFKIHFTLPPLDLILLQNATIGTQHEAQIFDGLVDDPAILPSKIAWADWILITTTPYHMWQCPNAEWDNIKKSIKAFPASKTVLIGLHATVFPEQTLRETGVHAVIKAEPESSFRSFLKEPHWQSCPGVSYLSGDLFVKNPSAAFLPPDELIVQDYAVDISKYSYFLLGKRTGVFEASRGCPWKCTFCNQEMFNWKYRTKTPEFFAEEVSRAVDKTGMKTAYFYDLEFTIKNGRPDEICDGLLSRGVHKKITWACQTRADMVDPAILSKLRHAGCRLVHFGVESANPHILSATNKKITLETIERGVRLAKEAGLQTACFFMFGLPEEKPEEFDNTLEFARKLNPTYASFHFAVPFPGTPLYTQYLAEKNLPWGIWPATYFDRWPHEKISSYTGQAFKKFYLMPKRWEMREFIYRLGNIDQKIQYFLSMANR
jgi:anaerobic magnesium-protoporphyrin IX monomethyl ester cyclase